ncbi:MAG: V-type ATPase 116kDa subunit family protein, partial [bacterium]
MIVTMSKVLVLIYHKSLNILLEELRSLGMVHIDVQCRADDPKFIERSKHIERIKHTLKKMKGSYPHQNPHNNPLHIIEEHEQLTAELEQTSADLARIRGDLKKQEVWGDFDPQALIRLSHEARLGVKFLKTSKKKFKADQWKNYYYEIIDDNTYLLSIVLFEKDLPFNAEKFHAEEVPLPQYSLADLKKQEKNINFAYEKIILQLYELLQHRDAVGSFLHREESGFDYENVLHNLQDAVDGNIYVLHGWIPKNKINQLELTLQKNDVAYHISRPEAGERVPVLLKNNRFSKLFEPITKLFDLPNYKELDLTPLFAPFFALFFGLCLGDAGYGLVIFIAA